MYIIFLARSDITLLYSMFNVLSPSKHPINVFSYRIDLYEKSARLIEAETVQRFTMGRIATFRVNNRY